MWIILLLTHAALALDPLSFLSDDAKRSAVAKAQQAEINRRTGLSTTDCNELFSDLPFENNTKTPFLTAFGTIQDMMGGIRYWDQQCLRQLAQNLSTLNSPIALRVAEELLKTDLEMSVNSTAQYCSPPTSGIEQILALSRNVNRIKSCTPLEQGKWKTVRGNSKSGIDFSYGLVQEAPSKFKAVLNVEFTGTNNGVTPQMMLERARTCMNSIKSGLKGPNGEQLSISLLTPREANQLPVNLRPRKTSISIENENARSHSKAYASSIGCPTILHEVLHLLGLCDEYPGESDNYPCRAVGNRDSVMRNQFLTFGAALSENLTCECTSEECLSVLSDPAKRAILLMPTYYDVIPPHFRNRYCKFDPTIYRKRFSDYSLPDQAYSATLESDHTLKVMSIYNPGAEYFDEAPLVCNCPETDQECKSSLREFAQPSSTLKPNSCPDPMTLKASVIGQNPVADGFSNGQLRIHRPASRPSLLEPRHFNRIMAGSCEAKTTSYERCAEFAYETSKVVCKQAPAQCLNNTTWGQ
ncbi:MAG: hypothetical protein LW878_00015 [Proteobacteria bacterium]|jgi:hypothetical protein|nr:hypothetical protein [Pseudomonadota bacterium]